MQILQWLFNISAQEPPETETNYAPTAGKRGDKDRTAKSKDIVEFSSGTRRRQRVEQSKLNCDGLSLFCFLQRRDVSRPLFYHTVNLKRVGSFQSMKMKKEDVARDSAAHVGNKVLPITDSAHSSSGNKQSPDAKAHKMKTISRMKELMKWASSARSRKSGKRGIGRMVFNFKNKTALTAEQDDDQLSYESPKISFKWEVESCSTTSSAISSSLINDQGQSAGVLNSTTFLRVRNQCAADGTGNWITTDSEFVVLEL